MKTNNHNKKKGRIVQILGGDVLESRFVLKQIPLVAIIVALCLVLVAVRYRVESLTKEKKMLEEKLKYMGEERVQMRRQYQESIRISRIDRDLDTIGIGLVAGPPYELKIHKK
ncbi:MAG: hypothetical protein IIY87_02445 [Bacteroidales bacterium]|nr:hypothetical protein [Bacteroidales bacterium]